jgi:DNA-binding PadR family transcriptional regulator
VPTPGRLHRTRRICRQRLSEYVNSCTYSTASKRSIRDALVTFEDEGFVTVKRDHKRRKQYSISRRGTQSLVTIFCTISFETGTAASVNETITPPEPFVAGYRRATDSDDASIPHVIDVHRPEGQIIRLLAHKQHRSDSDSIARSALNSTIKQLYGETSSSDRRALRRLIDRGVIIEIEGGSPNESQYRLSDPGKSLVVKCLVLLAMSIGATVTL